MSEPDPRQERMDGLLRRSMAAPVPRLSREFPADLTRKLRRRTAPPGPFGGRLLTGYGAVSLLTCLVVMRGQGLGWTSIATMLLGSLAAMELTRRLGPVS